MKDGINGKRGGVGGRSGCSAEVVVYHGRERCTHGRTHHPDTHTGSISRSKLKGVGESEPRRGEGSGTGLAKRKAWVAKRLVQWVRSTLCTCRLESHGCRLESPVERTEANGAGEVVDGYRLRVVGWTADYQWVTAHWGSTTEANR